MTRRRATMLYLAVACPHCEAPIGQRCRTKTGLTARDSHAYRWAAWWDAGKPDDPTPTPGTPS